MGQTYIIAEVGVNHNGSLNTAKELVCAASEAGADAVKFQTFKTNKIVSKTAPKADYQIKATKASESQLEMLKKLELDEAAHFSLLEFCNKKEIRFLSSPFDLDSVDILANRLDLPILKIASGEITNGPLLLRTAQTGKKVILSTGMSTLGEIETALGVLAFGYIQQEQGTPSLEAFHKAYCSSEGQQALQENVTLLHCTTDYPTPYQEVNLRAMDTLHSAFGLEIGFSDHTPGIAIAIAAVARGAVIIEKHFTLDRSLPGPDHQASLEPQELKAMVQAIRQVEKALGRPLKIPSTIEEDNKAVARKSVVAARDIKKGESLTADNITTKRPGAGRSPMGYWNLLGRIAKRDYQEDETI